MLFTAGQHREKKTGKKVTYSINLPRIISKALPSKYSILRNRCRTGNKHTAGLENWKCFQRNKRGPEKIVKK